MGTETVNGSADQLVAQCLSILIEKSNVWEALQDVIMRICRHYHGDAGIMLRLEPEVDQGEIMASYEVHPESSVLRQLEHTVLSPIATVYNHYLFHQTLAVEDISVFTKLCGICCQLASRTVLKCLYGVRLMVDDKVWGSIVIFFEDKDADLSDERFAMLPMIAHLAEICIMRDLNRRSLVAERDQALAADQAKSFFFASVSHNIRTPLNSILGFSELLSQKDLSQDLRNEYISNIITSGNILKGIVDDVLDLSKLATGCLEISRGECDFAHVCQDVVNLYAPQARQKRLALEMDIGQMPHLILDEQRMRQVLMKLVSNGVKYTSAGSVSLHVELARTDKKSGNLLIQVKDTGEGIDSQRQKYLMEPYKQTGDRRTQMGGTGLGLALCKAIISQLGGSFYINSTLGQGTTCGVTLPVMLAEHGSAPCVEDNPEHFRLLSVLLVDDVKLNLRLLAALCKNLGMQNIFIADSGKEALDLLNQHDIDLVLTDIWMPEMDGVALVRNMRNIPRFNNLPVIAVTADTDFGKNPDASLFAQILLKPITRNNLLDTLSAF